MSDSGQDSGQLLFSFTHSPDENWIKGNWKLGNWKLKIEKRPLSGNVISALENSLKKQIFCQNYHVFASFMTSVLNNI